MDPKKKKKKNSRIHKDSPVTISRSQMQRCVRKNHRRGRIPEGHDQFWIRANEQLHGFQPIKDN